MSLRQIGILLEKEFMYGCKNFFFVLAIGVPIVITIVFSLLFGTFFTGKPTLGICDSGNSRVTDMVCQLDSLVTQKYGTVERLKLEVEKGMVDIGLILPPGFDSRIEKGEITTVTAYIWGESLVKDRVLIGTDVAAVIRQISGGKAPFDITAVTIGENKKISWKNRLLPLIVLFAIFMGGFLIPSASLVNEKQKGTIKALAVSPVTIGTVYFSKGLAGFMVSLIMGILILILNGVFSEQILLLLIVLTLGAVMAAEFGILLGSFVNSIDTLFTMIKTLNLLIYGPAVLYMFPALPAWIGKIFPTYYLINPVIEITQHGAGWPDIFGKLCILLAVNLVFFYGAMLAAKREGAAGG